MVAARPGSRAAGRRTALLGAAVLGAVAAFAAIGPAVSRHGVFESDFVHGVAADGGPLGPSWSFPLGTDRLFRDVLARLAYAGRISLVVAAMSTLLAAALGAAVGVAAGWFAGGRARVSWPALAGAAAAAVAVALGRPRVGAAALLAAALACAARRFSGPRVDVDGLLMRAVDAMLAFPFLLLVMAIGAALDRTSEVTIFLTLGATGWLGIARVLRAKTMQVRSLDYVAASRALGQSTARVLMRHVLPNVAGPLVVTATMQASQMLLADAALAYLGLGVAPPTPTWGRMLFEGQDYYASAPWLVAAPAAAIVVSVLGLHMLAEGLRDALDPVES